MPQIPPEQLYARLALLIEQMPEVPDGGLLSKEVHQWLGQAHVLVAAVGAGADAISLNVEVSRLQTGGRRWAFEEIKSIVYRALAHAEAAAPVEAQGTFLPVGQPFDAFAAIAKIVADAKSLVRFV